MITTKELEAFKQSANVKLALTTDQCPVAFVESATYNNADPYHLMCLRELVIRANESMRINMIEFKEVHEWHIRVYINDNHILNITKDYHLPWTSEAAYDALDEQLSADDHRVIADKLDSLNNN